MGKRGYPLGWEQVSEGNPQEEVWKGVKMIHVQNGFCVHIVLHFCSFVVRGLQITSLKGKDDVHVLVITKCKAILLKKFLLMSVGS